MREQAAPEGCQLASRGAPDAPEADDAAGLRGQASQAGARRHPPTCANFAIEVNQPAGPCERKADGMIRNLFNAVVRNVRDPYPAGRRGRHRNVVEPDAEPGHDLERPARRNGLGRHFGPTGHDAGGLMGGDQGLDVFNLRRCGRSGDESHACRFHDLPLDGVVGPSVVSEQNGMHVGTLNLVEWKVFVDAKNPLRAEPVDAGFNDVASPEEAAVMAAETSRRSGAKQVAGLQPGVLREIRDLFGDAEDHVVGAALLHRRAVQSKPWAQRGRILEVPVRHEPGPHRQPAGATFRLQPIRPQ